MNLKYSRIPTTLKFKPQIYASDTAYEPPEFELLGYLAKMHLTGETPLETAKRCLVNEALTCTHGKQKEAARILGVSDRVMNYWCADLQLRPKDRKKGKE